jgi:hypothetical protein
MRSTIDEKRDVLAVDVFMLHYSRMESRVFFILFEPGSMADPTLAEPKALE